jgi:hypothetical protein
VSYCIRTIDQVPGTPTVEGPQLTFRVGQVTAREIVRARVRIEVNRHNSTLQPKSHLGLPRRERVRDLDPESQIEVALDSIRRGRVIILFNGEQVSDLDAPLMVTPVSEARFLRLVPLVGG